MLNVWVQGSKVQGSKPDTERLLLKVGEWNRPPKQVQNSVFNGLDAGF